MARVSVFALWAALAVAQTPGPEERARQFMDAIVRRDFATAQAMFDDKLGARLTAAALEQSWGQVQKGAGAFRRLGSARIENSPQQDVVFLTCEFEKLTLDLRLPVDRSGHIVGMNFNMHSDYTPPDYVNPGAFQEKEVMVGPAAAPLHGTLAIPKGGGPFPAVVLVHGSGAADRDYTMGPNKAFRDLAWGLASRGVAVLRYNKRANEYPREVSDNDRLTVKEETLDDAVAAVALLMSTPGIDKKRVFVAGHSLGATVAPRIGKVDPQIAGLILMAGTTRFLADELLRQTIYSFTLHGGAMTAAQQKQVEAVRAQVALANDPALPLDAPRSSLPFGSPASYWIDLRAYHPEQVARALKQPLLLMQGERDYQITMEDFAAWKKALEGKKDVEFKTYPKLNHLFLPGEGPSSDEEYLKPGHVDKAVVEDLAAWVQRH